MTKQARTWIQAGSTAMAQAVNFAMDGDEGWTVDYLKATVRACGNALGEMHGAGRIGDDFAASIERTLAALEREKEPRVNCVVRDCREAGTTYDGLCKTHVAEWKAASRAIATRADMPSVTSVEKKLCQRCNDAHAVERGSFCPNCVRVLMGSKAVNA